MGFQNNHLATSRTGGTNWATGTFYAVGNMVSYSNDLYISKIAHTSTDFFTDLSVNRWEKMNVPVNSINYMVNPDAELGTESWNVYQDADQATPVDGTGGAPTITWTRSTVSPLRGAASFLLTKPAGSARGQGVSEDIEIDAADQARVMQIDFDYQVASGTYATGDIAFYILDVTNLRLIQPSAFQVENAIGPTSARMTFQTSPDSRFYRVIAHIATTSTAAYSLRFDGFRLSPQVVPMGAPVTDWVNYTPSWTAVTTNPTIGNGSLVGRWRRVGDSAELIIDLAIGSTTSTGSGAWLFSPPAGLAIDTAKLVAGSPGSIVGSALAANGSAQDELGAPVISSGGLIAIKQRGASGNFTATTPFTWAAGNVFRLTARVPIAGWSSSTVVSSSADTRVVAAQIITQPNSTLGSAFNNVTWASSSAIALDTHGAMIATTGSFTAPVPGLYKASGVAEVSRTSGTAGDTAALRVINATTGVSRGIGGAAFIGSGVGVVNVSGEAFIRANAGDVIRFQMWATGTGLAWANSLTNNVFQISLIQGPSQIAASEVIAFRARTTGVPSSSPSLSNTVLSTVVFPTVEVDTHGGYNASTGQYTIPAPGLYSIKGHIRPSGTFSTAAIIQAHVYVGANLISQFTHEISGGSGNTMTPFAYAEPLRLNAGDVVTFRVIPISWTTVGFASDPSFHAFSVIRLGGVG